MHKFFLTALLASGVVSSHANEAPNSPEPPAVPPSKLEAAKAYPGVVFTVSRRLLGRLNGSVSVEVELREVRYPADASKRAAGLVLDFKDPYPTSYGGSVYLEEEDLKGLALALAALSRVQRSNQVDTVIDVEFGTRTGVVFKTTAEAGGRRRFEIWPPSVLSNKYVFALDELTVFQELVAAAQAHLQTAATSKR